MKILLFWLAVAALYAGRYYYLDSLPEPPVVFKAVAYKQAPVEAEYGNRVGVTNYYLIAADGSFIGVDMLTYVRTQPGQRIGSRYWHTK